MLLNRWSTSIVTLLSISLTKHCSFSKSNSWAQNSFGVDFKATCKYRNTVSFIFSHTQFYLNLWLKTWLLTECELCKHLWITCVCNLFSAFKFRTNDAYLSIQLRAHNIIMIISSLWSTYLQPQYIFNIPFAPVLIFQYPWQHQFSCQGCSPLHYSAANPFTGSFIYTTRVDVRSLCWTSVDTSGCCFLICHFDVIDVFIFWSLVFHDTTITVFIAVFVTFP